MAPAPAQRTKEPPASKLDWFDVWFPIAFTRDIGKEPYGFTLLEQPMWVPCVRRWRPRRGAAQH